MFRPHLLFIGATLAFPLFFTMGLTIFNGDASSYEFSLPLSFFTALACCLLFLPRVTTALSRTGPITLLLGLVVIALCALFQIGSGDWSLFFIYCVPAVLGFLLVWNLNIHSENDMHAVFVGFAVATVCASSLHLLASFHSFGVVGAFAVRGEDSIFGLFSIYQKYIYYATILAFGFFLVVIFFHGWIRWVGAFVLATDILLVGSREGALLVCFFLLTYGVWRLKSWVARALFICLTFVGIGFLIAILYAVLGARLDEFVFMAKFVDSFEAEDVYMLSGGRNYVIQEVVNSFNIDALFVFFGSGFRTDIGEIGTPHNQYIEWFLRGGLLFLLFNIYFLFRAVLISFKRGGRVHFAVGTLLFASLLICNNINTPFRVPYTSVWLWLLIGFSFRPMTRLATSSIGQVKHSDTPAATWGEPQRVERCVPHAP